MKCSRCKTERHVGVTDKDKSELETFKTCEPCRLKLKEYRRTHDSKKRKEKEDLKHMVDEDDDIEAEIQVGKHGKKRNKILIRKNVEFNHILQRVYKTCYKFDLSIDEVFKLEEFSIPYSNNIENNEGVNKSLLTKQTERDGRFKLELAKSFEIQYVSRIVHILKFSGFEFRFYSSSWKNGKYYVQYRCVDDKRAMKRFGIDKKSEESDNVETVKPELGSSTMKSKILDWIEPKNVDVVDLQLNVNNEPVISRFEKSIGYFCESNMNFIVDYTKFEVGFKLHHKIHRNELKKQVVEVDEKRAYSTVKNTKKEDFVVETTPEVGLSEKLNKLHQTFV